MQTRVLLAVGGIAVATACAASPTDGRPLPAHPGARFIVPPPVMEVSTKPSLPPDCSSRSLPTRVGDAYSPWGARLLLCSSTPPVQEGTPITIHGYVVDTNLSRAPECAVHPAGIADPPDCRAEIPTFWIGDRPDTPASDAVPVMGWASNYGQIYDAIADFDSESPSDEVLDAFWGTAIPNPLPAVGAEVRVDGRYGTSFTRASTGSVERPDVGVLTYEAMRTVTPSPSLATLPTMVRRGTALAGGAPSTGGETWQAKRLRGPFAKLGAHCPRATTDCLVEPVDVATLLNQSQTDVELGGAEPFRAVQVVARVEGSTAALQLAIQTGRGWFLHELGLASEEDTSGRWSGSSHVHELSYQPLRADAQPVIVVVIGESGSTGEAVPAKDAYQKKTTALVVCGLGKSNVPSCTAATSLSQWIVDAQGALGGYAFTQRYPGDGKVHIVPFARSPEGAVTQKLGAHALVFP